MDQLNEKLRLEEEEKLMGPLASLASLGMHKSPSTSSNGSRVAVPEEVRIPIVGGGDGVFDGVVHDSWKG